jgi:hypothetical protein
MPSISGGGLQVPFKTLSVARIMWTWNRGNRYFKTLLRIAEQLQQNISRF